MRGGQTHPLFGDDHDCWRFLGLLSDVTRETGWRCLAFCLMTTHYHLLVEEQQCPLSKPMQLLNSRYAIAVNQRHGRRGHLFAGRYGDTHVEDDEHLVAAVAYVARNPCAAGLCQTAESWPWSSYGALVGEHRPWSFVSSAYLLSRLPISREQLRELVNTGSDPSTTQGATRR